MGNRFNDKKNYTLAAIQQYLQGKLSPAEMHEMEKAAIQDPFLADAMEGYAGADPSMIQKELNDIYASIYREQYAAPAIEQKRSPRQWMIAASVILVLGAAAMGWLLLNRSANQKQTAQELPLSNPVRKDSLAALSQKNMTVQNNVTVPKKSLQKQAGPKEQILQKNIASEAASIAEIKKKQELTLALSAKALPVLSRAKDSAVLVAARLINSPRTILSETFAGEPAKTIIPTNAYLNNKPILLRGMQSTPTNDSLKLQTAGVIFGDGKNNFQLADKSFAQPAAKLGFSNDSFVLPLPNTASVQRISTNFVIDSFSANSLNEVVIPRYGTQKKKDITGFLTKLKENTLQPDGGWPALYAYLHAYLGDSPELHGDLVVELILKNGTVRKADIIKTFDPTLNGKLIKALKKGPKWAGTSTGSEKTKHQVIISL